MMNKYSQEMTDYVTQYVDYVNNLVGDNSDLLIEQRLSFDNYVENGFGTIDAIIVNNTTKTADVIDLKYGRYHAIEVVENTQLKLYALAVMQKFPNIANFNLHIVQPRLNIFEKWSISAEKLKVFGEYVRERVSLSKKSPATFEAGESQCNYCSYKTDCKALNIYTKNKIAIDYEKQKILKSADKLNENDIVEILNNKKLIEDYLQSVYDKALETVENGESLKGYKLVKSRSISKYKEHAGEVLEYELGDKAYNKNLISITEAKKIMGYKNFINLDICYKNEAKNILVKNEDKRISVKTVESFSEIIKKRNKLLKINTKNT